MERSRVAPGYETVKVYDDPRELRRVLLGGGHNISGCNGSDKALQDCAAKTDGFEKDGFSAIVEARNGCRAAAIRARDDATKLTVTPVSGAAWGAERLPGTVTTTVAFDGPTAAYLKTMSGAGEPIDGK